MVLQRGGAKMWGWSDPAEEIDISTGWGAKVHTRASLRGLWAVKLPTPAAGGPFDITIQGKNLLTLHDVLIGEVWVCSGQSNMEKYLGPMPGQKPTPDWERETAEATHPRMRLFHVPPTAAYVPMRTVNATWTECNPETIKTFSAAGYFFGRRLHDDLKVPIGLMESTWGGTEIEKWTSQRGMWAPGSKDLWDVLGPDTNQDPTYSALFNGMIAPLIPYTIAGAIWYQGEANVGNGYFYQFLQPQMIADWRANWNQGDFPFYFVQIAPYAGYGNNLAGELRESQRKTLAVKNTGMVVTTDITGDLNDIHPVNKKDVGERLALWALAKTYGRGGFEYSGPLFRNGKLEGSKVRVFFDHASGLQTTGGDATTFEVADESGRYHPAAAKIEGDTILLTCDDVPNPMYVRFGWGDAVVPNLFNKANLPASPFRTKVR